MNLYSYVYFSSFHKYLNKEIAIDVIILDAALSEMDYLDTTVNELKSSDSLRHLFDEPNSFIDNKQEME